jgi:predicted permease
VGGERRRRWLRLPAVDALRSAEDVEAELASHVAWRMERLMAEGLSESEARAEAERRLGGLAAARDRLLREARVRDARLTRRERFRDLLGDARYATRSVLRERGWAAVVIATLALGIGANATMFGLLDRLLLSGPAHVEAPAELYRFYQVYQSDPESPANTFAPTNYPTLVAFREGVPSVAGVSGYTSRGLTLGAGVAARRVEVGAVSAGFFELLGVRPVIGRFFDASEDAPPAGERVIVLSHGLWQGEFGGGDDVLGAQVVLSGDAYTVIGVAPPGFTGVELSPRDGWIPLSLALATSLGPEWYANAGSFVVPLIARLRPDATPERAAAEATAAWQTVDSPMRTRGTMRITLAGIRADGEGNMAMEARVARWLVAVSGIVLLVACANVANLHFARGLRRRREIAVRLALGVSRWRLVRLLLLETTILTLLGGAAALAVAYWGAGLVRGVLLPDIGWVGSPLGVRMLGVAAALTAAVGLLTGLAPALQAARTNLSPSLTGSVHAPPAPGRARGVLAALQAAFCVVLLVGAGLFVRSFLDVQRTDLGLEADRVLALRLEWEAAPTASAEERAAVVARRAALIGPALERLAALPGVERSSAAAGSAFISMSGWAVRAEGVDSLPRLPGGGPYMSAVSPDYFATVGTPLIRGRTFTPGDLAGSEPVVIVNLTMAEALWPGEDPLDRCVWVGGEPDAPCSRVVGVVANARRFHITEEAAMQFYLPLEQRAATLNSPALLLRTHDRPERLAEPARRVLHELEPGLRFVNATPFSDALEVQRRPWKLGATLFAICGGLALLIALIGLYSVIAYLVLHRRHEIGVRAALGADRRDIVGMVIRQSLGLAGAGTLVGLVVALLAAPAIEPLLWQTDPRDGVVFTAVAATLLAAALLAGALPAWRASRVSPTEALRD